jgi:hypothetical protein
MRGNWRDNVDVRGVISDGMHLEFAEDFHLNIKPESADGQNLLWPGFTFGD